MFHTLIFYNPRAYCEPPKSTLPVVFFFFCPFPKCKINKPYSRFTTLVNPPTVLHVESVIKKKKGRVLFLFLDIYIYLLLFCKIICLLPLKMNKHCFYLYNCSQKFLNFFFVFSDFDLVWGYKLNLNVERKKKKRKKKLVDSITKNLVKK